MLLLTTLLATVLLCGHGVSAACNYISPLGYILKWTVDPSSQTVLFNLTYDNFPQNSWTGVGFGKNMSAGLDVIIVALPRGTSNPVVWHGNTYGYAPPRMENDGTVSMRSSYYIGGTLNAVFTRPLASDSSFSKSLSGCVPWNFVTTPGTFDANGGMLKHGAKPEQQVECDISTMCSGTIPAVYLDTSNNGGSSNSNPNNMFGNQQGQPMLGALQNMFTQPQYNPSSPQQQNGQFPQSQQYGQQPNQFNGGQPGFNGQGAPSSQYSMDQSQFPTLANVQNSMYSQMNGQQNQPNQYGQNPSASFNDPSMQQQYPSNQYNQQLPQNQNGQFGQSPNQMFPPNQNAQYGQSLNQQYPQGQNGQYGQSSNQMFPPNPTYGQSPNSQFPFGGTPVNTQYNGPSYNGQQQQNGTYTSRVFGRKKRQATNIYG